MCKKINPTACNQGLPSTFFNATQSSRLLFIVEIQNAIFLAAYKPRLNHILLRVAAYQRRTNDKTLCADSATRESVWYYRLFCSSLLPSQSTTSINK